MNIIRGLLAAALFIAAAPAIALKLNAADYAVPVPRTATPQDAHITVIDQRPYVLDGSSNESYEGVSRELYGIPISRDTADKSPLATFLGKRIEIGFQQAGYTPHYLASRKGTSLADAVGAFEGGGERIVLTLREWQYDQGGFNPTFDYDATIDVFDASGTHLVSRVLKGTESMPKGGFKHFKRRWSELYQTILGRAFAEHDVVLALQGQSTLAPAADAETATVAERLSKLKALRADGIIDDATFEREQARILQAL
ncbi:hypothetical protein SAMN05428989_3330 [Pseudoxanthomonas sp. GM95]|uniref:SHOCT domain-containing protein n=1 Tax=Pseudoxanthomonas sp. GM95 TaxID=1881043 RepID=UPI0008BAFC91|nr:SHOCT domain-containing protein [Pseudoxanthomonas sp. GM95]SEM19481.1 hypothetical protein SAMN05428989_3330 [Pseudoxanthomonas sp. GM95]